MKTQRILIFISLALGLFALYGARLDFPQKEYYDEVYHVATAREFIALSGNTDTAHPPLGKILVAATMLVFGDHAWVWRLAPLLCGVGSLLIFFLLAEKFFKSLRPALFATILLALDGISITQSRIAMLNTPMLLFMLLSVLFFIRALENNNKRDWIFTGIFLGLTAATRWVGLGVVAVLGILALHKIILAHSAKFQVVGAILKKLFWLVPTAIVIYFAVHLILPFIKGYHWSDIWTYQQRMLSYHHNLKEGHGYGSEWWSWPLMTRPIWYFFERREELVYGIFCIGNPAIFWGFFPAAGYLVWHFFKTRCQTTAFVLLGFLSQWLPWALIGRVKFFHYYYPAMPFVVLALTLYVKALWETGRWGKVFVAGYAVLVLVMFIYWYPLYTGFPISEQFFQHHLWFKTWI